MNRVSVDDVDPVAFGREVDRRGLSDPLGTTDLAINRYRLPPGERLGGLHAHLDQEEVFLVVDGEATFETYAPGGEAEIAGGADGADGTDGAGEAGGTGGSSVNGDDSADGSAAPTAADEVVVRTGEAVRFGPGEYQSGRNDANAEAVVYAFGAPRDGDDVRVPLACPECGHESRRPELADDGETPVLVCPACASESPATCAECGGDDVRAVLSDGGTPVGVCRDCGAEAED